VDVVRRRGCRLGFTTVPAVATLALETALTFPRLDTSDLPREGTAPPDRWADAVAHG
jgi:hypothetical protein